MMRRLRAPRRPNDFRSHLTCRSMKPPGIICHAVAIGRKLCNHADISPASKIRPCYEPVMSISLPCATAVASTTAANGWPTSPPIRRFATLHDHSPAFMIASAKPRTSPRCRSSKRENDRRRGSCCPNPARSSNNARSAIGASPNGLMGCSGAPPTMCRRSSAAWRWCPNYSKQTDRGLAETL